MIVFKSISKRPCDITLTGRGMIFNCKYCSFDIIRDGICYPYITTELNLDSPIGEHNTVNESDVIGKFETKKPTSSLSDPNNRARMYVASTAKIDGDISVTSYSGHSDLIVEKGATINGNATSTGAAATSSIDGNVNGSVTTRSTIGEFYQMTLNDCRSFVFTEPVTHFKIEGVQAPILNVAFPVEPTSSPPEGVKLEFNLVSSAIVEFTSGKFELISVTMEDMKHHPGLGTITSDLCGQDTDYEKKAEFKNITITPDNSATLKKGIFSVFGDKYMQKVYRRRFPY